MSCIGIITTVGTSLKDNFREYLEKEGDIGRKDDELLTFINTGNCKYEEFIEKEFLCPIKSGNRLVSFPSAELQSLYLFFKRKKEENNTYKIYLLYTEEEGEVCANAIMKILGELSQYFGIVAPITLQKFNLDIENNEEFKKGLSDLFSKIKEAIKELKTNGCDKIFINITGGYKGLIPFLSLYGFLEEEVEGMIYAYESSKDILNIPPLPLEWNLRYLDEFRILLSLEDLEEGQYEILPEKIKDLYEKRDTGYSKSALAKILSEEYIKNRRRRFGYGAPLLGKIRNEDLRKKLEGYITGKWEHLWIGDQIPETVEHSRGHSLRLLELAYQLLEIVNLNLSDCELFALISAIWLHDIGHSGLEYNYNGIDIPVWMFPSLVRDWHNLLSYNRINEENYLEEKTTSDVIATIAKYHRNKMPLTGDCPWNDKIFQDIKVEPLCKELNDKLNDKELKIYSFYPLKPERVLLITALLRFIDGCDVQSDRVVDEDYLYMRDKRTMEEIEVYKKSLETYKTMLDCIDSELYQKVFEVIQEYEEDSKNRGSNNDHKYILSLEENDLKSLEEKILQKVKEILINNKNCVEFLTPLSVADKIIFKLRQRFHFLKHSYIKLVYIIKEGNNNGLKVVLLIDHNNPNECLLKKIGEDIYNEYKSVKEVLKEHFKVDDIYYTTPEKLGLKKIYPEVQNDRENS
jgi:CRISPR/Cas system-associated protein Csm6